MHDDAPLGRVEHGGVRLQHHRARGGHGQVEVRQRRAGQLAVALEGRHVAIDADAGQVDGIFPQFHSHRLSRFVTPMAGTKRQSGRRSDP